MCIYTYIYTYIHIYTSICVFLLGCVLLEAYQTQQYFFLEQCEDKLYAGGHRKNAAGGGGGTGRGGGGIQSAITQVSFDTKLGLFCTSIEKLN
jgi:hypothetical protein